MNLAPVAALAAVALLSLASRASCSEPRRPADPAPNASAGDDRASLDDDAGAGDAARRARPTEIAARHILVMHASSQRVPAGITRTRDAARARAEEALQRAQAGEDFAGLVQQYSDEPGAADRGGDLGTFRRGMMVRAFEEAAFDLEVNQISGVVETAFGFHVIQRTR